MIGTFLFFSFLVATNPNIANNLNYPMKEGLYQVQTQTVATPRYPNGKTETGNRIVHNDSIGQKWITNTSLMHTDRNNHSFIMATTYESTIFKDFKGDQRIFQIGTQGDYTFGTVTIQKDGSFEMDLEGLSNALGTMTKSKVVYTATKKGYDSVQTYYDEATKKWLPLRKSTFTFISQSSN